MHQKLSFDQIDGWSNDQHDLAFQTFLNSCHQYFKKEPKTGDFGVTTESLKPIFQSAINNPVLTQQEAKTFFETNFDPILLNGYENGFVTGYYEPIVYGSRTKTKKFNSPIYRRPTNLVKLNSNKPTVGISSEFTFARKTTNGYEIFPNRSEIQEGALSGLGLEIVYVENAIEAYFIHIQGSAKIMLPDNSVIRINYCAKNGHPYTAIGKFLIQENIISKQDLTATTLRDWLAENPKEAKNLMNKNHSFIFFKEQPSLSDESGPIGAAGIPLVKGRSLAIDKKIHTFGTPIWVSAELHGIVNDFKRLMIAQDTGSAIIGPARGDIFMGSGSNAGKIAGEIKHAATMIALTPKSHP